MEEIANSIASILRTDDTRTEKARQIADLIRNARHYCWVGIYDVGPELVSLIAYSGPGAPAYPQFPVTKGLTGEAIRGKTTVVAGDVTSDPRYLTAFSSTRSEIIIPVLDENSGRVTGTIDIESDELHAFSEEDERRLEESAKLARALWIGN
jgi:L-methionine (R)-S-oxide reductase